MNNKTFPDHIIGKNVAGVCVCVYDQHTVNLNG